MLELPGGEDYIDRMKAIPVRSAATFTISREGNTTGWCFVSGYSAWGEIPFTDLRIFVNILTNHLWVDTWSQIYSTRAVIHCWDKLPGLAVALKVRY